MPNAPSVRPISVGHFAKVGYSGGDEIVEITDLAAEVVGHGKVGVAVPIEVVPDGGEAEPRVVHGETGFGRRIVEVEPPAITGGAEVADEVVGAAVLRVEIRDRHGELRAIAFIRVVAADVDIDEAIVVVVDGGERVPGLGDARLGAGLESCGADVFEEDEARGHRGDEVLVAVVVEIEKERALGGIEIPEAGRAVASRSDPSGFCRKRRFGRPPFWQENKIVEAVAIRVADGQPAVART